MSSGASALGAVLVACELGEPPDAVLVGALLGAALAVPPGAEFAGLGNALGATLVELPGAALGTVLGVALVGALCAGGTFTLILGI